MIDIIDSGMSYNGIVYDNTGTVSVVLAEPNTLGRDQFHSQQWTMKHDGLRNAVHSVHVMYGERVYDKMPPLKALRAGWIRVQKEIQVFSPNTKRILFVGDTKSLRVLIPGLEGDMDSAHGTLFKLGEWIVVPTFKDQGLHHQEAWIKRDIQRCLKLTRPTEPLPYLTELPHNCFTAMVIDLETTGLDPFTDTITTLGLQWSNTERAVITGEAIWPTIARLIDYEASIPFIFHNAQFDLGFLGTEFRKSTYGRIRDTMVRAKARGELVASLKHLGNYYTARPGNYAWHDAGTKHSFDEPAYICEDLDVTWRLWQLWQNDGLKPVVELMERAVSMTATQTYEGTAINRPLLDKLVEDGLAAKAILHDELVTEYGVDPNKTDELIAVLTERGYVFSKKTESGKDALTSDVLEEYGLDKLLEYRKLAKLDSAFVGKMQSLIRSDGMLPHRQTMLGADTGRSTMSDYNHQQSGRKGPVRQLLVSRFENGLIGAVDLAQAELRVACYVSGDEVMAEWLQQKDAHRLNASMAFNVSFDEVTEDQRFQAKAVVFRTIYGGRPITDGQKTVHAYLEGKFAKLFKWIYTTRDEAIKRNVVTDPWGKTRNLLKVLDYKGKWAVGRAGINSPVQGLASHLAIWLTVRCWELFQENLLESKVLFGVHDSIIFDVHPSEVQPVTLLVQQAFRELPLHLFPLHEKLPITGELQFGSNFATVKEGMKILCRSN